MPPLRNICLSTRRESGATLLEAIVALAILATIVVVFLGGLIGTTKAASLTDERTTAESLAQSQMEWVLNSNYASQYSPATLPSGSDYINYTVNITATSLHSPDDGIQKITVTVQRSGKEITRLEGYKASR